MNNMILFQWITIVYLLLVVKLKSDKKMESGTKCEMRQNNTSKKKN